MTLEALPDFVVYDTISATPLQQNAPTNYQAFLANNNGSIAFDGEGGSGRGVMGDEAIPTKMRRRRRPRRCKNKEEAESQRMTHIAVERNRRRLMNEHLAVLRSLMPPSYIQRGDQASIVGGAIDFVKELEQLLQSLEVQKRTTLQLLQKKPSTGSSSSGSSSHKSDEQKNYPPPPPFSHFFAYPQYIWCHSSNSPEYPPSMPESDSQSAVGDIEVNLIETHANLRILTLRRPHQLLKMCTSLQTLRLSILHLNVTTFDSIVLYSISAKVEEGCNLSTVEDIAAAVHHILALFQAELDSCSNV